MGSEDIKSKKGLLSKKIKKPPKPVDSRRVNIRKTGGKKRPHVDTKPKRLDEGQKDQTDGSISIQEQDKNKVHTGIEEEIREVQDQDAGKLESPQQTPVHSQIIYKTTQQEKQDEAAREGFNEESKVGVESSQPQVQDWLNIVYNRIDGSALDQISSDV
jgi:hypothetical protein